MNLRDRAFQQVFSKLFVYNILWEDSEVDGRFLGVGEDSRVLAISAAGCGVAGLLRFRPRSVDAVDINHHHLALTALKARAATSLESYDEFYDLFGRGAHPRPRDVVRRLAGSLPSWLRRYWRGRHRRFSSSFYATGLTARMLAAFRPLAGVDREWLRSVSNLPAAERVARVDDVGRRLKAPVVSALLRSPAQLLALGINFSQRDRLLSAEGTSDFVTFMVRHLEAVAATDLETNWFAWYSVAGEFNHENPEAVPPYLRRESHARSYKVPTRLRFRHESIFDRLALAGPDTWTHYALCDAVDWMSAPTQRRLLDEIHRTSRDGAVMLYRSVEPGSLVERLGLGDRFVLMTPESDEATRLDRSRQYRRVNFYRVAR
jgi:S-adenosylmethionine-diacylglycerol 3-amino-3-carboxypropyl transferase